MRVYPMGNNPPLDVEVEAAAANLPIMRFHMECMPGTITGLFLRFLSFVFPAVALYIMASTHNFSSVNAYRYLVAASLLQLLWSFSLAILDIYALRVGNTLQNKFIVTVFTVGDWITSTLMLAAGGASLGVDAFIRLDLIRCNQNHCKEFEIASLMAFLSWFAALPSFLFNFFSLALLHPPNHDD